MNLKKKLKKISLTVLFFMLFNIIPFHGINAAFAVVDIGDSATVTEVNFVRVHTGKIITEGTISISGTGLASSTISMKNSTNGRFEQIPDDMKTSSDEFYLEYQLSAELTQNFDNEIRVGSKKFDLSTDTFPTITDYSTGNLNVDTVPAESIVIDVDNIAKLESGVVKAFYGKGENNPIDPATEIDDTTGKITLTNIPVIRPKGLQQIKFEGTETVTMGAETFELNRSYIYNDAFRLIGNLAAGTITMSPNTGSKDSLVTLTAPNLNDAKTYKAFFLKNLTGDDTYSAQNAAETVSLTINVDGTNDRLIIKVPNDPTFELRSYNVVLTEVVGTGANEEIIATQVVGPGAPIVADSFTVIGGDYIATLNTVNPSKGSDRGTEIQLIGNNLINVNVPDLVFPSDATQTTTTESGDKKLKVAYAKATTDIMYGNISPVAVKVDRYVSGQIGLPITFIQKSGNYFVQDVEDKINVKTGIINDSEDDPTRDIVLTIETVITELGDPTKIYRIEQVITVKDGFEFEPYSLTPVIDEVVPDKLQVLPDVTPDYKLKETVLLSIKGDKFLVDRYETGGEYKTNYPSVLIKVQETLVASEYDIKIDPNKEFPAEWPGYRGFIYEGKSRNPVWPVLPALPTSADYGTVLVTNTSGPNTPAIPKIIILDDDGNVMDGSDGKSVGTRMLVEIPKEAVTDKKGIKNIHIINPQRDSSDNGKEAIKVGLIEFVETDNFPVIESVEPKVVTVDGGEEITITGTNIEEGVKLYLDGVELTGFTRDIDPTGKKILVKFTAPIGREGVTQIQLVNTSGGMAVSDFTYVKSFNKDPELVSIAPAKGTVDTLVLANGDNFLRPDPTVPDTDSVNAFRLIGTRVYLDGKDVNSYALDSQKNIAFPAYDVPAPVSFLEFKVVDADTGAKQMLITPYWENIEVTDVANDIWWIDFDEDNNPIITDRKGLHYAFKYDVTGDQVNVFKEDGTQVVGYTYNGTLTNGGDADSATNHHVIAVDGKTFTLKMNNNIFAIKNDPEKKPFIDLVDYGESVMFKTNNSTNDFFVAYKDYDGSIVLSNGNDKIYTIEYDGTQPLIKYIARKESDGLPYLFSVITSRGFTLTDGTAAVFEMYSPYAVENHTYVSANTTNEIIGKRAHVISKTQAKFLVPLLDSGKGLKDVAVVNPDTKSAELKEGFDYVSQTSTHPSITTIEPDTGAVDGGYVIKISGKEFGEDMKVYIDSVLVPAIDTVVALDKKSVTVRVPECIKDLDKEFNVDRLRVPVVVLNLDGGSAYDEEGFQYVIPTSSPKITTILPSTGSTIGGEIIEIIGHEFRYFEPYTNKVGGSEYNIGDPFTDLNNNNKWDDLVELDKTNLVPKLNFPVPAPNPFFSAYYNSPVMPKVYLNEKEAKIVEFGNGYIKVITPVHTEGSKDLYVVNNDSGISNKIKYDYTSSNPTVTSVVPAHGRKLGFESRDIYGTKFASSKVKGYVRDDATALVELTNIEMPVQFGDITNRNIAREEPNSGRINAGRATVNLDGGLIANYNFNGATGPEVEIIINESNKIYRKTFTNYDNGPVYIPAGMLQVGADYYRPNGFDETELTNVLAADQIFEYIKVEVDDKRFLVDRGFAQKVKFDNDTHVTVTTPSYYTIDPVKLRLYNPDGGNAESSFTFNNPASMPKIYNIEPKALDATGLEYYIQITINGGVEMEVKGVDLREGAKVYIGDKLATAVDHTTSTEIIDGKTIDLDVLIVKVPAGSVADIDQKVPILVENTDKAVANSAQLSDLYGTINTKPYYFIYRKPLSDPVIESVKPEETSRHGGNTITFYGTDFRDGATVIIGSKGGVPVKDTTMSERGKKLVFVTPGNLTVGDKDVQVINADVGTGTKSNGLKVVSDPVQTKITKEDGTTALEWVSVEGGDKFKIIGTGFMSGAKVVIGGERTLKEDAKTEGETGLYIHDEYITVAGGTLATTVEYIDENTLLVTSPEILEEDTFIVTVFNADGGISDSNLDMEYKEPVPSTPLGLEGELINNQYIKIFNYTSDNFDYFEIYYYIGTQSETGLKTNNYRDFIFVDTTEIEPYRMTDIPNAEDLRENEKLWVVLRAFNEFGPSNWSNMIYFDYEALKDVERIGEDDADGGLEVPEWLDYQTVKDTTSIQTNIKHKDLPNQINLDYTGEAYKDLKKRVITLPSEIVKESLTIIVANYGDSVMQFMPMNLNTEEFRRLNFYEKSYGKVTNEVINNASSSAMKLVIPRGYEAVSPIVDIAFDIQNNTEEEEIDALQGAMDLSLYYGNIKLTQSQLNTLKIYKFNTDKNVWDSISGTMDHDNQRVYSKITRPGSYILIARKY